MSHTVRTTRKLRTVRTAVRAAVVLGMGLAAGGCVAVSPVAG
ncbi:hypothetical protein [Streptomyces sp. NPDC058240]